jgi:hypothetical protein
MALVIGGLLLALIVLAVWKGTGRNQGTTEQQAVDPRIPFEN